MSNNAKYNECPYCNSENIARYECDFDGSVCNNKVECHVCEKHWEEVYEITSRFDLDGNRLDIFETCENK